MSADTGNKHQFATLYPALERAVLCNIGPTYRVVRRGLAAPEPNGIQAGEHWYITASQCHLNGSHDLCFTFTHGFTDDQNEAVAQCRNDDTHNGCDPWRSIGGC